MNNIMTMIESVTLRESLWIFYLFFVIHELEEWNIAYGIGDRASKLVARR